MHGAPAYHPNIPQDALLRPRRWRGTGLAPTSAGTSDLVWSPNGHYAAYVLTESRQGYQDSVFSLCRVRADGSGAFIICSEFDRGNDTRPIHREPRIACWSPDGRRILFWKLYPHTSSANRDGVPLFDVDLRGGTPRLLTTPFQTSDGGRDEWMIWINNPPRFSPDGRHLLLIVGEGRFFVTNKRLALLEYPRGRRTWLTEPDWAVSEAKWSSNGQKIALAMTADRAEIGDSDDITRRWSRSHLWVMNGDGSGRRQITGDPRYRESDVDWVRAAYNDRSPGSLRFVRSDNADLSPAIRYESLRSQWEIGWDGRGLRKLHDLPALPPE